MSLAIATGQAVKDGSATVSMINLATGLECLPIWPIWWLVFGRSHHLGVKGMFWGSSCMVGVS